MVLKRIGARSREFFWGRIRRKDLHRLSLDAAEQHGDALAIGQRILGA